MTKVIFGDPTPLLNQSRNIQLLPSAADLSGDQKTVSDLIMLFNVSTDNVLLRASQTGLTCAHSHPPTHIPTHTHAHTHTHST